MPRASGWTRQNVGGEDISNEEFEKRVNDRIAEYEKEYDVDSLTSIDRRMLKNLSGLEVAVDIINQATMNPARFTPAELKSVTDSKAKLLSELRAQAASLGMDRKSRVTEEESELETYLPRLHAEAKQFLYKTAIIILCPSCLAEPPRVEIRQGTIIFNFSFETEWSWKSKCPRCGKTFEINHSNYTQFLYSNVDTFRGDVGEEIEPEEESSPDSDKEEENESPTTD